MECETTFVVVGGGIAGVSCAQTLSNYDDKSNIILISASPTVKLVTNVQHYGRNLEQFDVQDAPHDRDRAISQFRPNVKLVCGLVESIQFDKQQVSYKPFPSFDCPISINYDKICICTGAIPKSLIYDTKADARVKNMILVVRDTHTVEDLTRHLRKAKSIAIVGNGGIATELAYRIDNCQITWFIRESSIGSSFFDDGAAKFFLDSVKSNSSQTHNPESCYIKRACYTVDSSSVETKTIGSALGPDWTQNLILSGDEHAPDSNKCANLTIKYNSNVKAMHSYKINTNNEGVEIELDNGECMRFDLVVSATGVIPNTQWLQSNDRTSPLRLDPDDENGIIVDDEMRASIDNVYAAGDVCTCSHWSSTNDGLWFQKRLWTQAKQMGHYAALCMINHLEHQDPTLYRNFTDCFTHVTSFFGYKVILLGDYLGKNFDNYEVMIRVNPQLDYVKLILKDGHIKGAVLVGETELEETFENLILNQTDVSQFGEQLLDGTVDIDDYFD